MVTQFSVTPPPQHKSHSAAIQYPRNVHRNTRAPARTSPTPRHPTPHHSTRGMQSSNRARLQIDLRAADMFARRWQIGGCGAVAFCVLNGRCLYAYINVLTHAACAIVTTCISRAVYFCLYVAVDDFLFAALWQWWQERGGFVANT